MDHLPGVTLIDSLGASEGVMTRNVARSGGDIAPARFGCPNVSRWSPTMARSCNPTMGGSGCSASPDQSLSATTRIRRRPRQRSEPSAACGIRFRVTTRPWATTARSRSSVAVRHASTPAARRCIPKRSSSSCAPIRQSWTVWWSVCPMRAGARWSWRSWRCAGPVDDDELREHARRGLAGYKVPKYFVVMDSLQRSPAGKADYTLLRGLAVARLEELSA